MLLVFETVFSVPVISWIESIGGGRVGKGVVWVVRVGGEPKAG